MTIGKEDLKQARIEAGPRLENGLTPNEPQLEWLEAKGIDAGALVDFCRDVERVETPTAVAVYTRGFEIGFRVAQVAAEGEAGTPSLE